MRVVVVDDDVFKREGIARCLASGDGIEVVDAVDQDQAATRRTADWTGVDVVLVDVCDDLALGEVGTDVYSGINVVERVRDIRRLRCIAVTPVCAHPYVRLRLQHARPDYVFHRFQLNDPATLLEAVRFPDRKHRLEDLPRDEVQRLGGIGFAPNRLVAAFVESPLHGKLAADSGHKQLRALGIQRSTIDAYCQAVDDAGFDYVQTLPLAAQRGLVYIQPRWNAVRSLTLKLLGRKDAPPTEHDKPWW